MELSLGNTRGAQKPMDVLPKQRRIAEHRVRDGVLTRLVRVVHSV
jgi:hypothetical protein